MNIICKLIKRLSIHIAAKQTSFKLAFYQITNYHSFISDIETKTPCWTSLHAALASVTVNLHKLYELAEVFGVVNGEVNHISAGEQAGAKTSEENVCPVYEGGLVVRRQECDEGDTGTCCQV